MSGEAPAGGQPTLPQSAVPRWPRGLLLIAVLLTAAAPLAMFGGRIPGLGEFDYQIYYRLLFYNDFVNSLAMLAAFLVALAVRPLREKIEQLAGWITAHPTKTCIAAFFALAVTARIVYQGFPLAMDEYAPLLQARIFAQGDIAVRYPVELLDHMVVPGFQGFFILVNHESGQAVSAYWPGLALLMTPLAVVGGEWVLNPLMGAIGLWLIGDLAKQATGNEQARGWAILVALASPQYTANAVSYYAMSGLLTLSLLYIWLLLKSGNRHALLAGAVGSIALVLHNPVPHALIAAPCVVWLLADRDRRSRLLPLAIGYLPLTALLTLGWPLLIGSMGLNPTGGATTDVSFVGSWMEKLQGIFVLPSLEILQVRSYAAWKTLIWSAPGMLLVAFIARPRTAVLRLLLAGLLLSYGFYFFFPYDQGHGWGYRYVHPAWGLIPIAAGVFAVSGQDFVNNRRLVAAAICAGLLATPIFMHTTRQTVSTSITQQLPVSDEERSIVFITNHRALYTVDIVRNYPEDRGRVIMMLSQGEEADRALIKAIAPDAALLVSDERGSSWTVPAHASFPQP